MAEYVQLGAVNTWYEEHGSGDPLVLMHGGLVDARFFEPNLDALAEHFHIYTPERRGHGHTPDVPGPITYQLMADDTIAFLEAVIGQPADLIGHSDGAFVAMLVGMQRPELVWSERALRRLPVSQFGWTAGRNAGSWLMSRRSTRSGVLAASRPMSRPGASRISRSRRRPVGMSAVRLTAGR
jgi:pimeloyl-ACP methyl ester carboxylesterase